MSARDPSAPGLSVVVLSWNTRELLGACLSALARDTAREPREILVVDNGSRDGSAEMVARDFPTVRLLHNAENRLYAEGNNQGARAATGRYLCLLNSDTEVRPGALDRLVEFLETHPEYGAAAPKLVNADGSVQRACSRFPTLLDPLFDSTALGLVPPGSWLLWWIRMGDFDHEHSRDVPQPPGACFVMRRDEYLALGGLDPAMSLFFNDVDLCRMLSRGRRRIRYLSEAEVCTTAARRRRRTSGATATSSGRRTAPRTTASTTGGSASAGSARSSGCGASSSRCGSASGRAPRRPSAPRSRICGRS
jgi:GT2 family glycosyltransferase